MVIFNRGNNINYNQTTKLKVMMRLPILIRTSMFPTIKSISIHLTFSTKKEDKDNSGDEEEDSKPIVKSQYKFGISRYQ